MKPLVSFVIPVYQQEDYVEEAVQSALSQSYDNLEVIVVDDGSTDNSVAIINAIRDERLTLIRRENGGPSAALNEGIKHAQGTYIALLGGDDVAEPKRIEEQVAHAEESGADFIFCLPRVIDAGGNELNHEVVRHVFRCPDDMETAGVFRRLVVDGNFLCAPTALMRRETVETLGFFRHDLIQLQDYEYWIRGCIAGKTFKVSQKKTTRYRRHLTNLSGSKGDYGVFGELTGCILSALADAPDALIAEAFPDYLFPGLKTVKPYDRAMIALTHPFFAALCVPLVLQYFTKSEHIQHTGVSMHQLGQLAQAALQDSADNEESIHKVSPLRPNNVLSHAYDDLYLAPFARTSHLNKKGLFHVG